MAYVKVTENGKSTVLKVPDETCNHGIALLERWEEKYGTHVNEEAWARAMALRAKHAAEDKTGIYER